MTIFGGICAMRSNPVYVEDGDWYLNVNNNCRYLSDENHRCQNYGIRPQICRSYQHRHCDLSSDEYGYELHFPDDKQMEEYMRIKFGASVFDKLEAEKEEENQEEIQKNKSVRL